MVATELILENLFFEKKKKIKLKLRVYAFTHEAVEPAGR